MYTHNKYAQDLEDTDQTLTCPPRSHIYNAQLRTHTYTQTHTYMRYLFAGLRRQGL